MVKIEKQICGVICVGWVSKNKLNTGRSGGNKRLTDFMNTGESLQ